MRPSPSLFVRIIPRKSLAPGKHEIIQPPAPQTQELKRPTLIDILQAQMFKAGDNWPANIRIEPVVKREAFKHVQSDVRTRLKKLLKER